MMIRLRKICAGLFLLTSLAANAQSFSLKQAVDYAITHQVQVKNSQIDLQNASAKINEIKAMGLPQVNGSLALTNNIVLQRAFIPAKIFNPAAAEGELIAAKFGVDNSGFASVGLSQLVFDGSYLLGLKATSVYKDLAIKSVTQSKQQVAENVTKAYYGILVNEKRMSLLSLNLARLDTLLKETRELNKQGFVEKIDVQRLDVQVAKLDTESTAKSLGLTRATRFVNAFEVGYQNKSASNASLAEGYQVEFSLPLFDWGQARVRRAESVYMRSFYRAADVAIQARSEAREGYGSYRTNFDIARQYRDEIIPARKRISDEVLLRYNGMLSSVFELLADARAQITSINLAIDAQRDFWIAESELNFVVNGGSLTSSLTSVPAGNATPTSVPRAH